MKISFSKYSKNCKYKLYCSYMEGKIQQRGHDEGRNMVVGLRKLEAAVSVNPKRWLPVTMQD